MKKTAKKILAMILVVITMFTFVTIASADGGYEVRTGYDGVVRIPYGEITTLTFEKARGAKYFEFYSDDYTIVSIANYESPKMYAVSDGATFVYVYQFDKNGEFITYSKYIVVVYDEWLAGDDGRITDIYVPDISMKYDDVEYIEPCFETDGDVWCYTLAENDTNNAVSVFGNEIYTFDKGRDTIIVYGVDTNGNVVETTCTVTVRYTFFQWISNFFNSLFFWLYR